METLIWQLDPVRPEEKIIQKAAQIITAGGLCAFPTETVYGLGGNALDEMAAAKIYAAKGRPSDNPLIVHIAEASSLTRIATAVPQAAQALMEVYWPGPLTMIFEKTAAVPYATTGGLSTVAVRMPDHPIALALIRESGGYIAAPSANASGRPSPTNAAHVREDLDGRIDVILDGGPVTIGLESTIIDFSSDIPTVLRPGYVNLDMLREVIGDVRMDAALLAGKESDAPPKAPGMRYRHYAPQAELVIVRGKKEAVVCEIKARTANDQSAGKRVGILSGAETAGEYQGADALIVLGERTAEREIAKNLFAALRRMDAGQVDCIYSEAFDTPQLGTAIMNRLTKAAGYHIFEV